MSAPNHLGNMMRLCSRREYCVFDIRQKLQQKELDPKAIDEILNTLISEKFLSDQRYAAAFARDKSGLQGWGSTKIKLALQRKHISDDIITEALKSIDIQASQRKFQSVVKTKHNALIREDLRKNNNIPADRARLMKIREKLIRFAISRGYSMDEILNIINN